MQGLIFLGLCLAFTSLFAQERIEPVNMLQGNFQIIPASESGAVFAYDNSNQVSYDFQEDLTAAFGWMRFKEKKFRMMEISNISISYPPTREYLRIDGDLYGVQNATFSGAYRIEYGRILNKPDAKCTFLLSGGLRPFINYVITQPNSSDVFPMRYFRAGIVAEIIPRLMFRLSPKFLLDLNTPIGLINVDYNHFKVDNPAFTIAERTSWITNVTATLQNIGLRIGLTRQI